MIDTELDRSLALGARRILASKIALQRGLPKGYVHDPAVAILLSLFIDRLDDIPSTRGSVCGVVDYVSSAVTTRWLHVLAADGLIAVGTAERDHAISLTDRGETVVRSTIMDIGKAEKFVRDRRALPRSDRSDAVRGQHR